MCQLTGPVTETGPSCSATCTFWLLPASSAYAHSQRAGTGGLAVRCLTRLTLTGLRRHSRPMTTPRPPWCGSWPTAWLALWSLACVAVRCVRRHASGPPGANQAGNDVRTGAPHFPGILLARGPDEATAALRWPSPRFQNRQAVE